MSEIKNDTLKHVGTHDEDVDNTLVDESEDFDLLDVLFDEENTDPIVLEGENGKKIAFEQIAVIPMQAHSYCILKPIDEIEGIADDEGLVFLIDENAECGPRLVLETDEKTMNEVFAVYEELVDDANEEDEEED